MSKLRKSLVKVAGIMLLLFLTSFVSAEENVVFEVVMYLCDECLVGDFVEGVLESVVTGDVD